MKDLNKQIAETTESLLQAVIKKVEEQKDDYNLEKLMKISTQYSKLVPQLLKIIEEAEEREKEKEKTDPRNLLTPRVRENKEIMDMFDEIEEKILSIDTEDNTKKGKEFEPFDTS